MVYNINTMIRKQPQGSVSGWESPVAIHPGEHLNDFLDSFGMTQEELSRRVNLVPKVINEIINGKSSITRTTAIKLSKVFSVSSEYWINLQKNFEIDLARIEEKEN